VRACLSRFGGDPGTVRALLLAADPGQLATVVHCALTLARTLAAGLHTPQGMLAADLWLAECARDHPCRDTRLGAELILAQGMTCDPAGDLFEFGVAVYNAVCCEADDRFTEVLTAALVLWHMLLTEVGTAAGSIMVSNVAGQLWAGAEPADEGTRNLRARIREHDSTPRPTLPLPPGTEPLPPRPPLQPAYVPAGQPISYRGLWIRRQQESGLW
jgi:hypothetical protein